MLGGMGAGTSKPGPRRGRTSIEGRQPRRAVLLAPALVERIEAASKRHGVSVSAVIRTATECGLPATARAGAVTKADTKTRGETLQPRMVSFPAELVERIEAVSERRGIPGSAVIRAAVERGLEAAMAALADGAPPLVQHGLLVPVDLDAQIEAVAGRAGVTWSGVVRLAIECGLKAAAARLERQRSD